MRWLPQIREVADEIGKSEQIFKIYINLRDTVNSNNKEGRKQKAASLISRFVDFISGQQKYNYEVWDTGEDWTEVWLVKCEVWHALKAAKRKVQEGN